MSQSARFVSYLRVSTQRQGRSGLGVEAQREAVAQHLAAVGGTLMAELVEIESGRKSSRPVLAQALQACRVHRAVLVIAKLDRLARHAAFLLSLRDAGVEFVAADLPTANRLTVGIMALVAEEEARAISARTKAALAAAKARGIKLGNDGSNLQAAWAQGNRASVEAIKQLADKRALDLGPLVRELQAQGVTSLRGIATALNSRGISTPRGRTWAPQSVVNLLERLPA